MTENILIRLAPVLVYGPSLRLVELLGDRVGLTVSDVNDAMVAFAEYHWFNDCHTFNDRDFVDSYFMGDSLGYDVLYAVKAQLPEIGAYIPCDITSLKYLRTMKDGLYVLCTRDTRVADVRFNSALASYFTA